ncbi:MAG: thioredoxin-disulfide reductase [Oscillospiraceae bacterium]|nr:thioredoxin-disulfide reductase [Oscillospiraceae bacterium]
MSDKVYDVIIIGAGPAGLSAALYAGRSRLSTLIIEKNMDGGQIVITHEIENYPGGIEKETGPSLISRMVKQAEHFGTEKVYDSITEVKLDGDVKVLKGLSTEYRCRTVIVATGAHPRPIGCPGESEFIGKGVSYCATCDAAFFEDFEVYVVGGGDAAVEEALFITEFARKVTIIHRRDELRAAKSIQEKAFANPKIDFMWNSVVTELRGDGILSSMVIEDTQTGATRVVEADEEDGMFGLFVFVGFDPHSEIFVGKLDMDGPYIKADVNMKTNVSGVFVAGDVRVKSLRQVVTAAADGAIAATQAEHFLRGV